MYNLKRYTIIGIILVIIMGVVGHFLYEWTGNNFIIGFFFPINESTWEHMKLTFFPMLLYSFFMNNQLKQEYPFVTSATLFGILFSTLFIPVFFYTYSGILGYNTMVLDIATFIVSVLLAFYFIYKFTLSCKLEPYQSLLQLLVWIMALCFLVFTYLPPDIGLFKDPV